MPFFTVSEPHPTVHEGSYTHSGRGGAGNCFRAPKTTPASGVATHVPSDPPVAPRRFFSGRGGAGNMHAASDAPAMRLDEVYSRAEHHAEGGSVGHVGRGGAGNFFAASPTRATSEEAFSPRKSVDSASTAASSRRASAESGALNPPNFWQRLSGSHGKH